MGVAVMRGVRVMVAAAPMRHMRRGKVMRATEMRGTAPAMTAASAAPSVAASAATGSSAAATAALAEGERRICRANRDRERDDTCGKSQHDKFSSQLFTDRA